MPQEQQSLNRTITCGYFAVHSLLKHCTSPLSLPLGQKVSGTLTCSGQGGDGTQWECPVETTRKRGRRSSAWGSEELLVCQLENTGWCWDKERRGRRREASPSAAGKESYRIPRKVPANDTWQTFSNEYIPVTPSLSCTSCMNTFFVIRFVLIFQCRTERCKMLKSLRECSYTSETAKGRTAQPYLNYCAPTCPTIQGGKNGGTVQELKCK